MSAIALADFDFPQRHLLGALFALIMLVFLSY